MFRNLLNPDSALMITMSRASAQRIVEILDEESGLALKARGIYYAPDFVINGGGVINAAAEVDGPYNKEAVLAKVDNIYNSIEHILTESKKTGEPEGVIATRYAESLIYG